MAWPEVFVLPSEFNWAQARSALEDWAYRLTQTSELSFVGPVQALTLQVEDGVTAPDTVVGYAVIYVDVADGDLKVKFSDGTVKTIVVDT